MAKIKNPPITIERVKALLCYDQDTGIFFWNEDRSIKTKRGDMAGTLTSNGYVYITVDGHVVRAHRLAWFYVHGAWPGLLDHRDGVKHNNAILNLRECTTSQNAQNMQKPSTNAAGARGVQRKPGRSKPFEAKITIEGKVKHLGHYKTLADASAAYVKAKQSLHPFYAA